MADFTHTRCRQHRPRHHVFRALPTRSQGGIRGSVRRPRGAATVAAGIRQGIFANTPDSPPSMVMTMFTSLTAKRNSTYRSSTRIIDSRRMRCRPMPLSRNVTATLKLDSSMDSDLKRHNSSGRGIEQSMSLCCWTPGDLSSGDISKAEFDVLLDQLQESECQLYGLSSGCPVREAMSTSSMIRLNYNNSLPRKRGNPV